VRVFHRRQQHQAAGQRDQTRIPAHAITLRGNLFRPLNTVLSDRVYHLSGNAPKLFRIASASRHGAQTGAADVPGTGTRDADSTAHLTEYI
jgi:hypothetical protein